MSLYKKGTFIIVKATAPGLRASYPAANWLRGQATVELLEAANKGTLDVYDVGLYSTYGSRTESIYGFNIVKKASKQSYPRMSNPSLPSNQWIGAHAIKVVKKAGKIVRVDVLGGAKPKKVNSPKIANPVATDYWYKQGLHWGDKYANQTLTSAYNKWSRQNRAKLKMYGALAQRDIKSEFLAGFRETAKSSNPPGIAGERARRKANPTVNRYYYAIYKDGKLIDVVAANAGKEAASRSAKLVYGSHVEVRTVSHKSWREGKVPKKIIRR